MDMTRLSTPAPEEIAPENFADMWVALPDATAFALLGEARRLADSLGCYVHAVVADESLNDQAIALGADRVHPVPLAAFTNFLVSQQPEFAFFSVGQALQAAHLAQCLQAGLITDARNLSIDDASRALLGSHPVYGGDYLLDVAVTSAAKVATLDPRFCAPPYSDPTRSGEMVPGEIPTPIERVRGVGRVNYMPQAWRPLTRARIIVAIGRGLKDDEGVNLARRLAEKLGAEVGGDQSARDASWIDEDHLVGVTGQEVAPDLYLALGIRGDTVHNAAIAQARQVVAVHSNAEAAIFKEADMAIAANPKDFLAELLHQL